MRKNEKKKLKVIISDKTLIITMADVQTLTSSEQIGFCLRFCFENYQNIVAFLYLIV